jgi:type I restriction-modification system DNA methylase subunit
MGIFQKSVIQKHLSNLDKELLEKAYQKFRENYSPGKIEKIKELKEEEYQDGFLRDLFVDVFGYTLKPDDNYNLAREFKNQGDGKKADGAILKNEKAVAVIELKSTKTKDLKSITEQAFNYKNNQPDCKYVITSNFQKLRFYIDYANEFEEFDLFHLQKESFELLYLILSSNSILSDLPLELKEETRFHEQDISDKLYKDYSVFKNKLYKNLIKNNPENNKLILFNKSQKLLDRFLFILFAEDSGLLPPNSISRTIEKFELMIEIDEYKPIYEIFKQYFGYMNTGRKGKTHADDIPAYNGGLFYTDELLDNLKIDDKILIGDLLKLSEYDFNTEVDVNILGHIFEHSLSEIEEITAKIEGTATDKTKSKRKKDGVFYTPKYITQYIVENTIGTLCNEKRAALEIEEIEFDGTYRTREGSLSVKGKKLYQKLNAYKAWLLSLKIVDPACGSGAFLNQALNFLIQEHKNIDDIIAELTNTALRLFDTEKSILENNLFGVDINEESVEIAKLSLWLRTAQKGRTLSVLSNNIKCGNSLIDDHEVAGDKAFDWNVEFKEIMQNGGFDVVIGNPPYLGGREWKDDDGRNYQYFIDNYDVAEYQFDMYVVFWERGIKLIKKDGLIGFITPNTWLNNLKTEKLRHFVLSQTYVAEIVDYSEIKVFKDAVVLPVIFVLKKSMKQGTTKIYKPLNNRGVLSLSHQIPQKYWLSEDYSIININITEKEKLLNNKIEEGSKKLEDFAVVKFGIKVYETGKGTPKQLPEFAKENIYESDYKVDDTYRKYLEGKDINTYTFSWNNRWLKYGDNLAAPRNKELFKDARLLVRRITGVRLISTFVEENFVTSQLLQIVKPLDERNIKWILAVINSSLMAFYFKRKYNRLDKTFPEIRIYELRALPIKKIKKDSQKSFIEKADKMLTLNKQLQEKKNRSLMRVKDNFEIATISKKLDAFYETDFKTFLAELKKQKINLSLVQQDEWEEYFIACKNEINVLQNEINTTDKEIDQMVYGLYGLTEEEIAIVENSSN